MEKHREENAKRRPIKSYATLSMDAGRARAVTARFCACTFVFINETFNLQVVFLSAGREPSALPDSRRFHVHGATHSRRTALRTTREYREIIVIIIYDILVHVCFLRTLFFNSFTKKSPRFVSASGRHGDPCRHRRPIFSYYDSIRGDDSGNASDNKIIVDAANMIV